MIQARSAIILPGDSRGKAGSSIGKYRRHGFAYTGMLRLFHALWGQPSEPGEAGGLWAFSVQPLYHTMDVDTLEGPVRLMHEMIMMIAGGGTALDFEGSCIGNLHFGRGCFDSPRWAYEATGLPSG